MKKILLGILALMVIASNLFAKNVYGCVPVEIIQGDFKYKFSEKESLNNGVVFTINDGVLDDGHAKYNYYLTYDDVDYYKNNKNHLEIGIQTKPVKSAYSGVIFNYKEKDPRYIMLVCFKKEKESK